MPEVALVTGGAGYFGEVLTGRLLARGYEVRILDLVSPTRWRGEVEFHQADIRDRVHVRAACRGVSVVHHNVAQVPRPEDRRLFWSVNRHGTQRLLDGARAEGVGKVVYTSSSAVYGVPTRNPVTQGTTPAPQEDYGWAKLAGEELVRDAASLGLDCAIVRPRTILGHGRLGIFHILFEWVRRGQPVPVFDGGDNRYQFVHCDDLEEACVSAGEKPGFAVHNIGAENFGTMRELLEDLIAHAGSASVVKSLPMGPVVAAMNLTSWLGLSPLGPYHALMYGRSMYFDISAEKAALDWAPKHANREMIRQSYDWYLANRAALATRAAGSPHRSPVHQGIVALAPLLLSLWPG